MLTPLYPHLGSLAHIKRHLGSQLMVILIRTICLAIFILARLYGSNVVQLLNDHNIKFVPKSENPPNTPEIRCIENFWGFIKREVYKDGWEAENLDQLRTRIL